MKRSKQPGGDSVVGGVAVQITVGEEGFFGYNSGKKDAGEPPHSALKPSANLLSAFTRPHIC